MNTSPTTEERVWSVLAHLSAIATGMGLPIPILGWAEVRRKSSYTSFQSLQALGYQALGFTVWILLTLLVALVLGLGLAIVMTSADQSDQQLDSITNVSAIVIISLVTLLTALYFVLPLIAAVACALGRDFRYPFMGNRLAQYVQYGPESEGWLNEDREDRWVAAMGHFSVIIALWGMLGPVTAWIMQGRRSVWLKFQSAQALVVHAIVLLLSVVAGAAYFLGFLVFAAIAGFGENAALDSAGGMAGLAVLLASMLIAALILLLVPFFHILGQWAGYRILKGDDYRYPVIGKFVDRWFSNQRDTKK